MSIVESSVICQLLLRLWAVLTGAWADSKVGRGLRAFGRAVANAVRGSAICRFLWREGTLPRCWAGSLTARVLTFLINIPGAVCKWLYRVGKKVWDTSWAFRGVTWACARPFACLGIFGAVMLMVPHNYWDNLYGLYGAVLLAAVFAVGAAARPRVRLEPEELGPYYILFMAFIVYAFLGSLDWGLSIRFVGFHLAAFLLCVLAVSSVRRYEDLETLCVLIVAGLTVAAVYGCYQGIVGVPVVANQQDLSVNAGMPGRVYSFFDNPNNFAELLVMLTPLNYALFLNAKSWRGRVAALCSFGVCLASLGFTYSRSGFLGFALATVIFIAFWNWKLLPLLVVLGICAIPILPETIYNRILTIGNTKDTSTSYRFAIYEASWRLMKDYWYRGVGLGSDVLNRTFKQYPPMFDNNYPLHTHNNYLQMWAETGILGGLAFLGTVFYQIKKGTKAAVGCRDGRVKNLLAAALAGFCGIALISIAEYTWFYPRNMFFFFLLFGLIAGAVKLSKGSGEEG